MSADSVTHNEWGIPREDFDSLPLPTEFAVISKQALQREIARATARVEERFLRH